MSGFVTGTVKLCGVDEGLAQVGEFPMGYTEHLGRQMGDLHSRQDQKRLFDSARCTWRSRYARLHTIPSSRCGLKQQGREDTTVSVPNTPPKGRTQRTQAFKIMTALYKRLPQINLIECPSFVPS